MLPSQADEEALVRRWTRLREIRGMVTKRLEEIRATGEIGSSLQAEVALEARGADAALLESLGDELRFVLITSKATLRRATDDAPVAVSVAASAYAKCERCWHYREDVGAVAAHPTICARCVSNLEGPGEKRLHA